MCSLESININTMKPTTDLIINNGGGVMQALGAVNPATGIFEAGIINLRSNGPDIEAANTGVWGGTLDAPGGINMFGKDMEVAVDRINGPISNTGSLAHISVNSGDLVLGTQTLSGDPTYFNSGGDITISSISGVDGDLAFVASGNIFTTSATSISTTAADKSIFPQRRFPIHY